jgi:hypothetical protein
VEEAVEEAVITLTQEVMAHQGQPFQVVFLRMLELLVVEEAQVKQQMEVEVVEVQEVMEE